MRRFVMVGLLAILATACGAGGGVPATTDGPPSLTDPAVDAQLGALAAAMDLWATVAPDDYTLTLQERCPGCDPGPKTLAVRQGEVVSLSSPADSTTVDGLFGTIEESLRAGADVQVEYHPESGYPVRLVIDLDGDGSPDIDVELGDLEAMPIVENLDQLRAARRAWDAAGLDTYRYIFRADCTCPDGGTFDVDVRDGRVTVIRPLDDAAETSTLTPGALDDAFDDLEDWFTDSAELIDEGILAVDVRMDPELGYPRWFRVEAESLDEDAFAGAFTIVVTIDLVLPYAPLDGEPLPPVFTREERDLELGRRMWQRAALTNYRYVLTLSCECLPETSGPFVVTVRKGEVASVEWLGGDLSGEPNIIEIPKAFELIAAALEAGTEVDVEYDETLGFPTRVIIDVEAVAVDGGLAFRITEFEPLG